MALNFLSAWGCEDKAFSKNSEKEAEAKSFVSNHFVNSEAAKDLESVADSFDYILSTVNTPQDWM